MKAVKILITGTLAASLGCTTAFAGQFSDVPENHWAGQTISAAAAAGIMSGMEDGTFGLGQNLTRAQFVSMLTRMFGWEKANATAGTFSDNTDTGMWYFKDIETAVQHGVVTKVSDKFRPNENITREEMAVMLVRALGYEELAAEAGKLASPFQDVSSNQGYITLAYDFGIVSGVGEGIFSPQGTATREEAAAMMMRCYEKINSDVDFVHGFYAFSSYSQKEMAGEMDAVSFGWGRMQLGNTGVVLNTTAADGNEWSVPNGYEEIVSYLKEKGVQKNLNIFLSDGDTAAAILNDSANRQAAINAIIEELTVEYRQLGYNPYDGVTIDFENLKGTELKQNFTAFLDELKQALAGINKKLYVAVQPNLKSGSYFDGYDFKEIGEAADKVILMAYNYQTTEKETNGFTTTPVTPFDEVYYGLKTLTDKTNGVQDREKILLGLSPAANVVWNVTDGGAKRSAASYEEITALLEQGAKASYSEKYRNPYLEVQTAEGKQVIWYENKQSIEDKMDLMKMFGIHGVSLWRLGLLSDE